METLSLAGTSRGQISSPCREVGAPTEIITKSGQTCDDSVWHTLHNTHTRGEPVIEVCSISIFKRSFISSQEEQCQVYGDIRVMDLKGGKNCLLYSRGPGDDDLDVISFHHNMLTLMGPADIISMKEPMISIDIKDKVTGAIIVKGTGLLLNATTEEFEIDHCLTVRDETGVGTAHVEYVALRYGVAAVLEVELVKNDEGGSVDGDEGVSEDSDEGVSEGGDDADKETDIAVYGSILAYYSNGYCRRRRFRSVTESPCTKLFDKPSSESQVVTFGSPIQLSRWLVAVPAYSSLIIDMDLRDPITDEPIVRGKVFFESGHCGNSWEGIPGERSRNLELQVGVEWKEPFMVDEAAYDKSVLRFNSLNTLPNKMSVYALPLLEVFSVLIGRPNDEQLRLYGKIEVYDRVGHCNIFTATKNDPYILLPGYKRLPLQFPPRTLVPGDCFYLYADLTDEEGHVIIKGYGNSSYELNQRHKSWYDRRLCSVIKGAYERGFAALNHMVFPGIRALLKVNLFSTGSLVSLYGRLVAFYSKYEYLTDSEREDFRSVLFERSKKRCLQLQGDVELELSQSVIPVPLNSSLLIEVDLKLRSVLGGLEHVFRTATFEPGASSVDIQEGSCTISISVEWSDGDK